MESGFAGTIVQQRFCKEGVSNQYFLEDQKTSEARMALRTGTRSIMVNALLYDGYSVNYGKCTFV